MPKPAFPALSIAVAIVLSPVAFAEPKPVPAVQALPQPDDEVSFQRDGVEFARFHFSPLARRPFVFPLIGPSGRSLTRMGHPRDPHGHSHHNSVWISHQSVNGLNFWEDRDTRITHQRVLRLDDGADSAFVETENAWLDKDGNAQMHELRRIRVQTLPDGEWILYIDTQLEARTAPVELGNTAFGVIGVRMAKTIGVRDGGGTIRNSEGGVDERGCFRKPARWVDYSGPITATASEGIALMDHPENLHHPVPFHVRDDGWMGAALNFPAGHKIEPGGHLRLRYALWIHAGIAKPEAIEERWKAFAATAWTDFPAPKK